MLAIIYLCSSHIFVYVYTFELLSRDFRLMIYYFHSPFISLFDSFSLPPHIIITNKFHDTAISQPAISLTTIHMYAYHISKALCLGLSNAIFSLFPYVNRYWLPC